MVGCLVKQPMIIIFYCTGSQLYFCFNVLSLLYIHVHVCICNWMLDTSSDSKGESERGRGGEEGTKS